MAEALDPIIDGSIEQLATRVLEEAHRRRFTLATAESCTGGLLASLLTDIPGLSHVFERGFVVYTNQAKAEMLRVDPGLLERCTAVCEPVARQMAEGALRASRAEIAVSITGWAEGGSPERPAGLVYFGSARRGRETRVRQERFGDVGRARLRIKCLDAALRMALERMEA